MTDQNREDLLSAVFAQLYVQQENFQGGLDGGARKPGIPVGDTPVHIGYIDYKDGGQEIWLRLTDGSAWVLRACQLGERDLTREDKVGTIDTLSSYHRYQQLRIQVDKILAVTKSAIEEDVSDAVFQTWFEQLDDDAKHDWLRWTSGGFASSAEWNLLEDQGIDY